MSETLPGNDFVVIATPDGQAHAPRCGRGGGGWERGSARSTAATEPAQPGETRAEEQHRGGLGNRGPNLLLVADDHVVEAEDVGAGRRVAERDRAVAGSLVDEAPEDERAVRRADCGRYRQVDDASPRERQRNLAAEITDVRAEEPKRGHGRAELDRERSARVEPLIAGGGETAEPVAADPADGSEPVSQTPPDGDEKRGRDRAGRAGEAQVDRRNRGPCPREWTRSPRCRRRRAARGTVLRAVAAFPPTNSARIQVLPEEDRWHRDRARSSAREQEETGTRHDRPPDSLSRPPASRGGRCNVGAERQDQRVLAGLPSVCDGQWARKVFKIADMV